MNLFTLGVKLLVGLNFFSIGMLDGEGYYFKKKFFFNVYLLLRERDRVRVGEGQRETHTQSEAGSRLRAVSTEPDVGLELTNHEIMT